METLGTLVERYHKSGRPHMPARQCHDARRYFQRYLWAARRACVYQPPHRQCPLGQVLLGEITRRDLEALRDATLAGGLSGQTAAQIVLTITTTYRWAVAQGYLPDGRPPTCYIPGSNRLEEVYTREQFIEILKVAQGWGAYHYTLVLATLNTGMRKGELFGLRKAHVTPDKIWCRHSYAGPPKSGKPRPIPITPELAPVLADWLRICPPTTEDLVFPVWAAHPLHHRGGWRMGTPGDMVDLPCLLAEADVPQPTRPWHAFRHTFASQFMQRRGKSYIYQLKELLGHADLKTTERYLHFAPDWLSEDMKGLGLCLHDEDEQ